MENKTKKVEIEIPVGKVVKWVDGALTLVDEKPQDVTERIKTFADACRELGSGHPFVKAYNGYLSHIHQHNMNDYDLVSYLQLRIIAAALNEGWEPKFTTDEYRYFPWFVLYTEEEYNELSDEDKARVVLRSYSYADTGGGVACVGADYDSSSADSSYGSRLAFKNSDLAKYAGKQFIEIYADFIFKPKSEETKG